MAATPLDAVTGGFGYTGRAIAERLLSSGRSVRTLTNHPDDGDPWHLRFESVAALDFSRPAALSESLRGVDTLYNTYWVRFDRGTVSFDRAVVESTVLFMAARAAGVRRVVHVSIANPDEHSPLPYYRGKAAVERALLETGLSYAIVRPTVVVGDRDILVHNIAWLLRHLPVFGIAGDGRYPIQPVMIGDLVRIAVETGADTADRTIDAVGPETFGYEDFVRTVGVAIGTRARIARMPPMVVLGAAAALGTALRDVVITRDELRGLMDGLLVSHDPPTGVEPVSAWLAANGAQLGRRYANELHRHFAPSI